MAQDNQVQGQQTRQTASADYNTIAFICTQLINKLATVALVKVVAVTNDGDVSPVGTVDVQPLVNQLSGNNTAQPHGTIFGLPYFRLHGGANAVIIDPQVGDVGVCVFCMRDSSAAVQAKGQANPGSARKYDWADGLYIGGFLSAEPTQFVQFNADGVRVLSPTKIVLEAPTIELKGAVDQTGGDVTMSQKLTVTGEVHSDDDVTAQTVSLHDHVHGGVQSGGSSTAPPTP